MYLTIEQASELLGKHPKTLYRYHALYNIGDTTQTEYGERLIFEDEDIQFIKEMLADTNVLAGSADAEKIIDFIKAYPGQTMNTIQKVCNLDRNKTMRIIVALTHAYPELCSDIEDKFYWLQEDIPVLEEKNPDIRYVFKSTFTENVILWTTNKQEKDPDQKGYTWIDTNLYRGVDRRGKYIFNQDYLLYWNTILLVNEDIDETVFPNSDIIGNTYLGIRSSYGRR